MTLDQLQALAVLEGMALGAVLFIIRQMVAPLKRDISACMRQLSINGTEDTLRSKVNATAQRLEEHISETREHHP